MPSSKCTQISLILGELYNDIKVIFHNPSKEQTKLIFKQLSEYAKRFDDLVETTEKNAYDAGYNAGGAVKGETPSTPSKLDDLEKY